MTLDNLHRKLFQDDGFSKMLRPDILPEHEASSGTVSMLSKSAKLSKAVEAGGEVETAGCGFTPGNNSLMVFRNGYKLIWGVDYEEGEIDSDLGVATSVSFTDGCAVGDVLDFVAHGGVEYVDQGEAVSIFTYTVAPQSTKTLTYCPLDSTLLTDGIVDINWGDGTSETLVPGNDDYPPTHAYQTDDGTEYTIWLSATNNTWAGITGMFFGTSTSVSAAATSLSEVSTELEEDARVRYLVKVNDQLPVLGFTHRDNMFRNNVYLRSVCSYMFANQAGDITSFYYTFAGCQSLVLNRGSGLFDGCSSATNFNYTFFNCGGLTENGLFGEEAPRSFFTDCTAMKTAKFCFYNTIVNSAGYFFNQPLFSGLPNLEDVSGCFREASIYNIEYPLFEDLPSLTKVTDSTEGCFTEATIGGYLTASIFSNLPAIVNFGDQYSCFHKANFDVKSFTKPILSDLPELVSTAGKMYGLFHGAHFTMLPDVVFKDVPKLENLSGLFRETTVDAGLQIGWDDPDRPTIHGYMYFRNLSAATDFSYCFYNCPWFVESYGRGSTGDNNLFDACTKVKNFAYCFAANENIVIADYWSYLFTKCTEVENFSHCFAGCGTDSYLLVDLRGVNDVTDVALFSSPTLSGSYDEAIQGIAKVWVTKGTTTADTFSNTENACVQVTEY